MNPSSREVQEEEKQDPSHVTCSSSSSSSTPKRGMRFRLPSGDRVDEDPRRIDAVVLTLDDVLYDHTGMLGHLAIDRAINQLLKEKAFNSGSEAYNALQTFRNTYGYRKRFPRFVDSLVTSHTITNESGHRVIEAYYASQIPEARKIKPFPKAQLTLKNLKRSGYMLGLLLVGKKEVTKERLVTLGIEKFFSQIIYVPSNPTIQQLTNAMKEICRRFMLQPSSIAFVGRKVFYEIKAANKMGFITIRMVRT
jgi:FMN phosphatase YigB (HAD superfamily)